MSIFNNISHDFYNTLNNFGSNPFVLVVLIFIILIYYLLFAFLGGSNESYDEDNRIPKGGFVFIEALLWGLFIVLVFINGLSYFFNINIITELKNLLGEEPEINIESTIDVRDLSMNLKEVYHVPGNRFTYHDAKAVCNAFEGELATYDQLRSAQQNGASWCSYGWTKDQLGLYPTSHNHWKKLKEKEGHEYDCGLPGVNGGYVSNPHVRLGSNCYGYKPKQSDLEVEHLSENKIYPKTNKELLFESRVDYWKDRLGNVLLAPFNNENWYKEPSHSVENTLNQNENAGPTTASSSGNLHHNYFRV